MEGIHQKVVSKMETKKKAREGSVSAVKFFGEAKQELRRIDWTTPDELRSYTKVVLLCTFFFGLSIYLVDLIVRGGLEFMNLLVKWLVG